MLERGIIAQAVVYWRERLEAARRHYDDMWVRFIEDAESSPEAVALWSRHLRRAAENIKRAHDSLDYWCDEYELARRIAPRRVP